MRNGRALVLYLAVLALCVLHQDFWWWDEAEPLVFGFLPVGLAWHLGISIAAALVWFLMVTVAWPRELRDFDAGSRDASPVGHDSAAERAQ